MKNKLVKKIKKGFSLIELIAAVAILGTLAVILIPKISKYGDSAKESRVKSDVGVFKNIVERYEIDNGEIDDTLELDDTTTLKLIDNGYIDKIPMYIQDITINELKAIDIEDIEINGNNITLKNLNGSDKTLYFTTP